MRSVRKLIIKCRDQPSPIQHNDTQASTSSSSTPSKSDESEKDKAVDQVHKPIFLFSNRLKKNKQNAHMVKILEMFNQVKINVSLLDVI